jgi:hypothetical protein
MSDFNNKLVIDLFEQRDKLRAENERLTKKIQQLYEGAEGQNQRIKRLEEAGDALKASGYFGGWADAVNKWIKAKEDEL